MLIVNTVKLDWMNNDDDDCKRNVDFWFVANDNVNDKQWNKKKKKIDREWERVYVPTYVEISINQP